MDLELVITQLSALKTAKTIAVLGGAADLSSAQIDANNTFPVAYVIPLADRAGSNSSGTTFVRQRVETRFGVLLGVKSLKDAVSRQNLNNLTPVRKAIQSALIGWMPAGSDDLVTYGSGKLLKIQDGVLWWQDEFITAFYLRSQ